MLTSGELVVRPECEDTQPDISDDSLSNWPPSIEHKDSLRKGFYTSFEQNIFRRKSHQNKDIWSSLDYPPSPKDAFQETCEFYGDPLVTKQNGHSTTGTYLSTKYSKSKSNNLDLEFNKLHKAQQRKQDFYKSDSKLSDHFLNSLKTGEVGDATSPLGRSKSLHDLQHWRGMSAAGRESSGQTVGLSEQDLNRARSDIENTCNHITDKY